MATRYGGRTEIPQVSQWLNAPKFLDVSYTNPELIAVTPVTLTASTTAHTYGAWTEVVASLASDTSMLNILVGGINQSTVDTSSVVSIGIGASGSETELFYYAVGSAYTETSSIYGGLNVQVPVSLPAGTRVAARLQSLVTGGKTGTIQIQRIGATAVSLPSLPKKYDSLGVNLATSTGTDLPALNVYQEIVASTTNAYRGLVLIPSVASTAIGTAVTNMTVGVGASGSEIDIGTVACRSTIAETIACPINMFFPFNIPAGSRIAVKQSINSTSFDASVIGVHI
jgi:hypothetical protein